MDLDAEIERMERALAAEQPPQRHPSQPQRHPLDAEIERMELEVGDEDTQRVPTPTRQATMQPGPALLGTGASILPIIQWFAGLKPEDKQMAYDLIGQTIGTGVGITAGAPGGPPTMIGGGVAGSVIGKDIARRVGPYVGGNEEYEPAGGVETAIDAGTGAVGPVLGPVVRGTSRYLTGLSRKGVTEAERAGAADLAKMKELRAGAERAAGEEASSKAAPFTQSRVEAYEAAKEVAQKQTAKIMEEVAQATRAEIDYAIDLAIKAAKNGTAKETIQAGATGGIAGGLTGIIEPLTGFLVGVVGDKMLKQAIPKLLEHPKAGPAFARWALNVDKGAKPSEILASFTAIAAQAGLDIGKPDEPQRETSRPKPLRERRSERPKPPRDERGRFVGGWDHSALEEMFRLFVAVQLGRDHVDELLLGLEAAALHDDLGRLLDGRLIFRECGVRGAEACPEALGDCVVALVCLWVSRGRDGFRLRVGGASGQVLPFAPALGKLGEARAGVLAVVLDVGGIVGQGVLDLLSAAQRRKVEDRAAQRFHVLGEAQVARVGAGQLIDGHQAHRVGLLVGLGEIASGHCSGVPHYIVN